MISMLFATYDDDMGGDQYDRLPGALQSWGETSVWLVTLCWQESREPQLYTSRVGTDLPSALQR
jgi:hypothetical protein